jgi:peroxiredoxin
MAVQSRMIDLGSQAPDFALPDPEGTIHRLSNFAGAKALLVAFICNHCPYVKHILPEFAAVARDYKNQGLAVVAISANDVKAYPDDAPAKMAEVAREHRFVFPYLYDETQETARAYGAACTPDLYLFDLNQRLVYHGQFDDTRPDRGKADGADLRAAVTATLAGHAPSLAQRPSVGCSIKWKPGAAPNWA